MSQPVSRPIRPWWTAVVCGAASYIDAATIVSMATVLVIYQTVIGLRPAEIGLLSGLLTLGIAIGALVGGRLGDRFGRRSVFIVTMIVIAVAAVTMMFAESFSVFVIAVGVIGLATGADLPVSLSTVAEAADDARRGKMLGLGQLFWLAGAIIPGVLGAVVGNLGRTGAQILLAHIAIAALLVLIGRLTIPESRSWTEARRERGAGIETVRADRAQIRDLFRAPYVVPFVALLVFGGLGGIAGNVYGQFGTYMLVNAGGVSIAESSMFTLLAVPPAIIGGLLFMKAVGGKRRFRYFQIAAIAVVVSQFVPVLFGFSPITYVITLLVMTFGGSFAGEAIAKLWTQQSFPTLIRTTAQGTVIAATRFAAAGAAPFVPLVVGVDVRLVFVGVGVLMAISLAVAWIVFRRRDSHNEIATETLPDPDADSDVAAVRDSVR